LNRPRTSKPRGICSYYNTQRGCFAGDTCKFIHAETSPVPSVSPQEFILTPYDAAKTCRYYANGYCRRGANCWFRHVDPNRKRRPEPAEEDELLCSICLEKPLTFGLLGGCSHVFCIQCIRQWRDPANKSGDLASSSNTKKCPMCRAPSKFITPCSRFWKDGEEGKERVIEAYKQSMSRVPCRYFQDSKAKNPKKPFCRFGRDCFYQHLNDDGTKYVFKDGVDVCMKIHSQRDHFHTIYDYEPHFFGAWAGGISMFAVDLTHEDAIPDDSRRSRPRPPNALDIPHTSSRHGNNSNSIDADSTTAAQRSSAGDVDPPRDGEVRRDLHFMEQIQRMAERFMASFEGGLFLPPVESGRSSPVPRQETPPPLLEPDDVERPATGAFERINQNASTIIEIEEDQTSEPPFVTDGRGRVVWSAVNNSESSDVQ